MTAENKNTKKENEAESTAIPPAENKQSAPAAAVQPAEAQGSASAQAVPTADALSKGAAPPAVTPALETQPTEAQLAAASPVGDQPLMKPASATVVLPAETPAAIAPPPAAAAQVADAPVTRTESPAETQLSGVQNVAEVKAAHQLKPSEVMGQDVWTRRRVITVLISVGAGTIALFWPRLSKLLPQTFTKRPYYLKTKKKKASIRTTSKPEGFYGRTDSSQPDRGRSEKPNILQYVDNSKQVRFVAEFSESKRERMLPLEPPTPSKHVNYSRASVLFEMAALQQVSLGQYDLACRFLIAGIQHDLEIKKKIAGRPSLRLWDLLAKLSVRRNQPNHLGALLSLKSAGNDLIAQQHIGGIARREKKPPESPRPKWVRANDEQITALRHKRQKAFETRLKRWEDEVWKKTIRESKEVWWTLTVQNAKNENAKISVKI